MYLLMLLLLLEIVRSDFSNITNAFHMGQLRADELLRSVANENSPALHVNTVGS